MNCTHAHSSFYNEHGTPQILEYYCPLYAPYMSTQPLFHVNYIEYWGLLYKMFRLNGLSVYYKETELKDFSL